MKRLTLLLIIIVISFFSQGQEEKAPKKGWIGFSMGAAIPVGDFGVEDGGNAGRVIAFPIYVDYLHTNPSVTLFGITNDISVDAVYITFGLAFRIR